MSDFRAFEYPPLQHPHVTARMKLLMLLVTLLAVASPSAAPAQQSGVIAFRGSDTEMSAAISKARSTLDIFWKALEKPGPNEEGHSLEVRIAVGDPRKNEAEHIWVVQIERLADDRLAGRYANQPQRFRAKVGERVVFRPEQISDWIFVRNGRFVGMQTMRPMLAKMPKEQADHFRSRLESP